jgi:hypothetical protein
MMFEMFDTALDMEVRRRREVLLATMRAARGRKAVSRRALSGTRARNLWAAIATVRL